MLEVLENLMQPQYWPFTLAIGIVMGIGVLELIGIGLMGIDLHVPDGDMDALDWLGLSGLPLMVVVVVFLTMFGASGIAIQSLIYSASGGYFPLIVASGLAFVSSILLTTILARPAAGLMPKDETDAVSLDELLWMRATVVTGTAYALHPARARVRDRRGTTHYVMLEPADGVSKILEGDEVTLSRREGDLFYALTDQSELRSI